MNTFVNHYPINFFFQFPLCRGVTFLFYFIMTAQPLSTHYFCSSENLQSFKAKPQSNSTQ